MERESLTEKLARFLVTSRREGIAKEDLDAARTCLLDWIGSVLAGSATYPGGKILDYSDSQPQGPASIVGRQSGRSAEVASFVNGALSHIVEMDDVDRASVLHPGAVVIPAALAISESEASSGRDLLGAIVAGYEIAVRIGTSVGRRHYFHFHNTSTCGVFGAAAASSWLLGLDEERTMWSLGNAGTQASGLWEFNSEGAMSKHLHAGRAAANGALAALLAARGFTGPRRILEGERGLFAATAPDAAPERVVEHLGSGTAKIRGVSMKPHASCRHTHPAIDCAISLRPAIRGAGIESVEIDTYEAALALCDRPRPSTPYDAKFSFQYCVASALVRGRIGLAEFGEEALRDREVRELSAKVRVGLDPALEKAYPSQWRARVRVLLANDQLLEAETLHPKGDPERPLSFPEIAEKFRELSAYGGYGADAERVLEWVDGLAEERLVRFPSLGPGKAAAQPTRRW